MPERSEARVALQRAAVSDRNTVLAGPTERSSNKDRERVVEPCNSRNTQHGADVAARTAAYLFARACNGRDVRTTCAGSLGAVVLGSFGS